jgi:hypothetical protein
VSKKIETGVKNEHPPPYSPKHHVEFENFNFAVVLQNFTLFSDKSGWEYFEQSVSFKFKLSAFEGASDISESGYIYIFTTNKNHKSILVDSKLNFEGEKPTIEVYNSTLYVEQGDLLFVGKCGKLIST